MSAAECVGEGEGGEVGELGSGGCCYVEQCGWRIGQVMMGMGTSLLEIPIPKARTFVPLKRSSSSLLYFLPVVLVLLILP